MFIDKSLPLSDAIWDAKMPGELISGEVSEEVVTFQIISAIDVVIISGRTIAGEFQWQEPASNVPIFDPSDIGPIRPGNGDNPIRPIRVGRYGDFEPIIID